MALPKALRFGVLMLVICFTLDQPGFRQSVSVFFQDLRDATSSILHSREKREASSALSNFTEHDFQFVITFSDLESLQRILSNISFPIAINNTVEITSIETTTVCSPNITGYQCVCEENFAWSYNNCITYGVCDAIAGDTCGCINGLPADGQFCQSNSSQTVPTTTTPSSTQANDLVDIDVDIIVSIPTSSISSSIFSYIRSYLQSVSFPILISQSVGVKELYFTTACNPNFPNGLQCQCESGFAWPCDTCNSSNSCSNQTCTCLYGLPPNDEFCQPVTNATICRSTPTPPTDLVDIDVDIMVSIPTSRASSSIFSYIRSYLQSVSFPILISQSLGVKELYFTTACNPNFPNGLQCQCESGFAWPCDTCNSSNSCSNQTCTCLYGLPPNDEFCQPVTNATICRSTPTPPTEIDLVLEVHIPFSSYQPDVLDKFRESLKNKTFLTPLSKSLNITELFLTTVCDPNSTYGYQCVCESGFAWPCDMCSSNISCSSQVCTCIYGLPSNNEFCEPITNNSICLTPSPTPVDIDVDIMVSIPTSRASSSIFSYIRSYLQSVSFPILISQSLGVKELYFTTACNPNFPNGLQCQCESGFAWPCDTCNSSNSCSNQTCTCLYGLPPNDEFCQPVTNATICRSTPTPPTEIDLVLEVHIPFSSYQPDVLDKFRESLKNKTFLTPLSKSLNITELFLTTVCDPNSTYGYQCVCESGFAWPCDMCSSNISCSSQVCTCIYGLPSNNEFCEPITNNSICLTPSPTPVDIDVDIMVSIPTSRASSSIFSYIRSYLQSVSFPILISQSLGVKELYFTTACNPNFPNGLQCQCESGFAWPCDTCNSSNSCSNQTCTCLYGLPPNDEFCQPVTNATICRSTPTPPTELVDFEVVLVLQVALATAPSNLLDLLRAALRNQTFPIELSQSVYVLHVELTTACSPNSTNELLCQCEQGFVWPCDMCNSSNSCNDPGNPFCTCLNGLPSNNNFCQPITNSSVCPTPTPVTTVSTNPSPIYEIDLVLEVHIPFSSYQPDALDKFREFLKNKTFLTPLSKSLNITELFLTTVCDPNSTYGYQCVCESGFAWPCDMCSSNISCSSQVCTCIYGLPSNNEFCEPITNNSICLTPSPTPVDIDVDIMVSIPTSRASSSIFSYIRSYLQSVSFPILISQSLGVKELYFTTACDPNFPNGLQCQCESGFAWPCDTCNSSNSCSNQTCTCLYGLPPNDEFCQPVTNATICRSTPTPPTDLVDIDVDIMVSIPTSRVSSSIFSYIRSYLQSVSFPILISQSVGVKELYFTTACDPNFPNGLQCQCESGFAWPCDTCNSSNSCSNQTCTCLYGLPPNDEFCQPVTNATICRSTPTPPTAGPTTAVTTAAPLKDTEVTVVFRIPASIVQNYTLPLLQSKFYNLTYSVTLPAFLNVKKIDLTTVCYPNPPEQLRCQCEDSFAWSCDLCNTSNSCSGVTSQQCTCRDGLSSINQFCQPLLSSTPCPVISATTSPPSTVTPGPTLGPTQGPTPGPTQPPKTVQGSFTMDMAFSESFNDKNNDVYKSIYDATLKKCTLFLEKCAVKTLNFTAGSTVANYELDVFTTETPPDVKVTITKNEILSEVASKYPVSIVSSNQLTVDRNPLYVGDTVKLTCDTSGLTITNYSVTWKRNEGELPIQSMIDKLTIQIPTFSKYDDGNYECKITWGAGSTFIQRGQLTSTALPLITVSPIKDTVKCSENKILSCQAEGWKVTLFSPINEDLGVTPYNFEPPQPCVDGNVLKYKCKLTGRDSAKEITLVLTTSLNFDCTNETYGNAMVGNIGVGKCDTNYAGEKTAVCMADGSFGDEQDKCVLQVIADLLDRSKNLNVLTIPVFLEDLKNATVQNTNLITESPATLIAMIKIFENVANATTSLKINLSRNSTKDFLESAGFLTIDNARGSWAFLNYNDTRNTTEDQLSRSSSSSAFLDVFENLTKFIGNDSLDINTDFILLNKTRITEPFSSVYNSSVEIEIPEAGGEEKFITIIIFASMYNVLPGRDELNTTSSRVHGRVALVRPEVEISNISLTFDVINYTNDTIGNPKCVFWDFTLYDGLGGWSDDGCSLVYFENETVSCNCNHTTSFSILMSPNSPRSLILDYITYIGVGISMACLVICLIIEAIIWRKIRNNSTSYLRHVSIINIALSLLIANIWFIIGAAISDADKKNPPACTAATFFIHFFYLALFFWMLASALLLLYRTLSVFDGGLSKLTMLIIGFALGYGAPLIIAVITIASTAPSNEYIRENTICWLNWDQSKALLAFVIPALMIVAINLIILIVVLYKILRRRVGGNASQTGEKHVLYVIARSLAVLTPFFGLTWGLGIGTMVSPQNFGIHVAFAFFNSLQGFFILVFGTLLDRTVWSAMNIRALTSQGRTASTSGGTSSSGLSNLFRKMRINRGSRSGYHVSSTGQSGSNEAFNT
ncbi:uncharacterized protein LOC122825406 [Gambusia affinis]|nr:uncharacterized protein LOC122825406 [Gambusia affinis]